MLIQELEPMNCFVKHGYWYIYIFLEFGYVYIYDIYIYVYIYNQMWQRQLSQHFIWVCGVIFLKVCFHRESY